MSTARRTQSVSLLQSMRVKSFGVYVHASRMSIIKDLSPKTVELRGLRATPAPLRRGCLGRSRRPLLHGGVRDAVPSHDLIQCGYHSKKNRGVVPTGGDMPPRPLRSTKIAFSCRPRKWQKTKTPISMSILLHQETNHQETNGCRVPRVRIIYLQASFVNVLTIDIMKDITSDLFRVRRRAGESGGRGASSWPNLL